MSEKRWEQAELMLGQAVSLRAGWTRFEGRNEKTYTGWSARKYVKGRPIPGADKGLFITEGVLDWASEAWDRVLSGASTEEVLPIEGGGKATVSRVTVGNREGMSLNLSHGDGSWKGNVWVSTPDAQWFGDRLKEGAGWVS